MTAPASSPAPRTRIYLASSSPRRRELLRQINVGFDLLLTRRSRERGSDISEAIERDEIPDVYVTRIARVKAEFGWRQVVMRRLRASPVLAADTTVVLDGKIMGKPDNAQHAQELLRQLSGKTHQVLSAVAVAKKDSVESALSISIVELRALTEEEIWHYVAGGESLDKAGGYAIQGRAALFVRHISGSYSGIMGLPLYETAELLRHCRVTF